MSTVADAVACPLCGGRIDPALSWSSPPEGETHFDLPAGQDYEREFRVCSVCGHYVSVHGLDLSGLYSGAYVDATYGADGMRRTYDRIMGLPPEGSDNFGRVARVDAWARAHGDGAERTVLDVGSGLAVFPVRMKQAGWDVTALDPDERAAEHARSVAGVTAVAGDFMERSVDGHYALVTFNKVLEHVPDPVAMLARARSLLTPGGAVYVEVPDGEAAAAAGGERREEFFIEHLCAFSPASLALLCRRAGFAVELIERIREPSDKYTLYAFARPV
jgi:SAM-dependent methyltransferase